jgi:hypothetical protein
MKERVTTILFLFFSIAVAFANLMDGKYHYLLFIIPFVISLILQGKHAKYFELFGIIICSMYIIIGENIYIGIIISLVASVLFYTENYSLKVSRIYIGLMSIIVFVASFFTTIGTKYIFVHSLLDVFAFYLCTKIVWISIAQALKKHSKPLENRYLDVLEETKALAEDAIKELKARI